MTPQDQIYSLPTNTGLAKMAYAQANQLTVNISKMAIGDGGGAPVMPGAAATGLVREVHRAQLNQLYQHPTNANWLVAELVLPAEVGGWTIREIGLYDDAGDLIYVGNHAEQYKPIQSQGSDETKTIRMVILVSNTASVTLRTDPTTVLATVDYVQREIAKLDNKQSVRFATKANINLTGLSVQAGGDWSAALSAGDRVLVKNQAAGAQNGIYIAGAAAWTRSVDADENADVTPSLTVSVESGATLADTVWQLITDAPIVVGTTALAFQDITNGLARLASPSFSGSPSAPTPPTFDNSQRLATMEALQRALGNRSVMITNITAIRNMTLADLGGTFVFNGGSGTPTCVLPDIAGINKPAALHFYNTGSVSAVVQGYGGVQVIAKTGGGSTTSVVIPPGGSFTLSTLAGAGGWFPESGSVASQFDLVSFGALLANPGWRLLPSGEIENWGTLTLTGVGSFNQETIGGTTFYTNYYNLTYPMAYKVAPFEAEATLACATFASQTGMAGKAVSLNLGGTGNALTGMTVAVTTKNLGEIPTIHWRSRGK